METIGSGMKKAQVASKCCSPSTGGDFMKTTDKPNDANRPAKEVNNIGGSANPNRTGKVDMGGGVTYVG